MDLSYFADFEGTCPVTNSRLDAAHHSKKISRLYLDLGRYRDKRSSGH